jgi:oxygen-independent coproporphyrinogen-3 oxidase
METETVSRVLKAARSAWPLANDCEITLEANPTSVDVTRFGGYAEAGVNRVSMGVQALNDDDLQKLGRLHSVSDAIAAFQVARSVFGRVSFDLIYARQDQTVEDWREELTRALDMAVDHLSLYQLTIEEGTAFGDRLAAGGLRGLPDEDRAADMWDATQELTSAAGLPAYEISNHARAGAESTHNLIYWRNGDYVGIGPGAHGRLTLDNNRFATETPLAPGAWLEQVERTGSGESGRDLISSSDRLAEFLLMGLRTTEGIPIERLRHLGGERLFNNINYLIESGFLQQSDDMLRTTTTGRPVLNSILREILAD